jgi:hypothetical protein
VLVALRKVNRKGHPHDAGAPFFLWCEWVAVI